MVRKTWSSDLRWREDPRAWVLAVLVVPALASAVTFALPQQGFVT